MLQVQPPKKKKGKTNKKKKKKKKATACLYTYIQKDLKKNDKGK